MRVLIMGACGNMGRRYSSIVRHLGHEVVPVDVRLPDMTVPDWEHAILATPTPHHLFSVVQLMEGISGVADRHLLIEKPVANSLEAATDVFAVCRIYGVSPYVVNQYQYLPEASLFGVGTGTSRYDYYNSGQDGLAWDCFQIFANATGPVSLDNRSPIWQCTINGVRILSGRMDHAYVDMVEDFLGEKKRLMGALAALETTKKIEEWLQCKRF